MSTKPARKCHVCGDKSENPGRFALDIVSPGDLPDVRYRATVCSVTCLIASIRSAATDYRKTMRGATKPAKTGESK